MLSYFRSVKIQQQILSSLPLSTLHSSSKSKTDKSIENERKTCGEYILIYLYGFPSSRTHRKVCLMYDRGDLRHGTFMLGPNCRSSKACTYIRIYVKHVLLYSSSSNIINQSRNRPPAASQPEIQPCSTAALSKKIQISNFDL